MMYTEWVTQDTKQIWYKINRLEESKGGWNLFCVFVLPWQPEPTVLFWDYSAYIVMFVFLPFSSIYIAPINLYYLVDYSTYQISSNLTQLLVWMIY